jgi:hypothetical protein
MMEFIQRGTATSEVYCKTLTKLRKTIQNKRHGMLTSGMVLFHDQCASTYEYSTRALLEHFSSELFDHAPHSPHLTRSDYYLLTYLNETTALLA